MPSHPRITGHIMPLRLHNNPVRLTLVIPTLQMRKLRLERKGLKFAQGHRSNKCWGKWRLVASMKEGRFTSVCVYTCTRTCFKIAPRSFWDGASGKESACQCRRLGSNPWVGKMPWRRAWQPTLVFVPGKPRGQWALAGYSPRGRKESDTTEQLSTQRAKRHRGRLPGVPDHGTALGPRAGRTMRRQTTDVSADPWLQVHATQALYRNTLGKWDRNWKNH